MKNILMIGNSSCYYYVDELCGIAAAVGHDINLCNLYYAGCSLKKHWEFYTNNSEEYEFYHTTNEKRVMLSIKNFTGALEYAKSTLGRDWDMISLQQSGYYALVGTVEYARPFTLPYAKDLFSVIRKNSPEAALYWHQAWAYELGFGENKADEREHITTLEKQTKHYTVGKEIAYMVAGAENLQVIPVGDAWQIVRANKSTIGQTLCARKGVNHDLGDHEHDGDIGGGQYLNACVWFEVLMKESCIGNTWRPDNYELSEKKIEILQKAAHDAVAAVYGADYAK